ncbi:histone-lysine N-methyltransferase SETMAR-like [Octopus sinensis]|uniref:Histone-lysine N-methyltransferase SETMAR-like n=1 Tax=Octopus sinensis TaxID=2607531 RepID=A0A6P7SGB6_9MOLL|nr:histone-lysine N-methyltransferase SETMAR-like [Octopus sinensis]
MEHERYHPLQPLEHRRTINADVYYQQLDCVNEKLCQKPALVIRKGVILQHDNGWQHSSKQTQEKIRLLERKVLSHPSYASDLAPMDFHLFRSLKHDIRGKRSERKLKMAIQTFGHKRLLSHWAAVDKNNGDYILD